MPVIIDIFTIHRPELAPDLSSQAAQLVLEELGDYKKSGDIEYILAGMADRTTVVALDGYEQVIATAGLRMLNSDEAAIEDVATAAHRTRQGIGQRVILELEHVARTYGVRRLNLESTSSAISFYLALDYAPHKDQKFTKQL